MSVGPVTIRPGPYRNAAEVGRQAADLARRTEDTIAALGASSAEIGDVAHEVEEFVREGRLAPSEHGRVPT